ncbi:MAG TPA: c-type cytochrome [Herpetosiphonaceae bacterium]
MTKNIAISLFFTLATVALLGYIWFGQTAERLVATNARQEALQLEFGQRNYEQYCASCHGLAGGGGMPPTVAFGAPSLNDLQGRKGPGTAAYTSTNGIQKKYGSLRNYVEYTIANGVRDTAMPAWKANGMRDDQVKAIAAYVISMQGGSLTEAALANGDSYKQTAQAVAPTVASTPVPTEIAAGAEAFMGCRGCHTTTTDALSGPGLAGLFGAGTKAYGKTLPNGKEVNTANVREWIIQGGGGPGVGPEPLDGSNFPPMLPKGGLPITDEQVDEIVKFLEAATK